MQIEVVILNRQASRLHTEPAGAADRGFDHNDTNAAKAIAAEWATARDQRILDSHYSHGEYKFWVEHKDAWRQH
jgi:hypothetical protein